MKCPFTAVHPREARKFCRGPRPSLSEARSPSQAAEDEGQDQRVQPWGHPGHAAAAQEVDRPKMTLDRATGSGVSLKGWGGSGEMEGPGGTEGSAGLGARRRMQGRGFHLQGSCLGSQRLPGGGDPGRFWQGPVAETSLLGERLSNQDRPPARLSREPPCHCRVPKRKGGRGGALPAPRPRSWAQRSPQGKQTPCLTASPNVHLSLHKPQLQRGPRPPRPTRTSGTVQDRLPGGLSQAESG